MSDLFLVNYSVSGIKSLNKTIELSFFNKIFRKPIATSAFNIKSVYGMNGSGKSGIISSIEILKNILINPNYLNNLLVQSNLDALINKDTSVLSMEAEFLIDIEDKYYLYRYSVKLEKDAAGKYVITYESLDFKNATSRTVDYTAIFKVNNGVLSYINKKNDIKLAQELQSKTYNLLSTASVTALFAQNAFAGLFNDFFIPNGKLLIHLCILLLFGKTIHVYLDQADDHTNYFVYDFLNKDFNKEIDDNLVQNLIDKNSEHLIILSPTKNNIPADAYDAFSNSVVQLTSFLKIFKKDLINVEIDSKPNGNTLICSLIMDYGTYKVNSEFESTGIKKLIRLYAYIREMVNGGIVFIDEFDSNLHDVYLCALLEYLMEYGKGQLCFTTHNVAPMEILKDHKKSIDFLSADKKIYSWTSNGHYSPSSLYKKGMIEGSPFNVDSFDFIGIFDSNREDKS